MPEMMKEKEPSGLRSPRGEPPASSQRITEAAPWNCFFRQSPLDERVPATRVDWDVEEGGDVHRPCVSPVVNRQTILGA
jgi:hypothetical protein